jgi:very-short-patch-repair endonuclease
MNPIRHRFAEQAGLSRGVLRSPAIADPPIIACTDGAAPHLDRRGVYVRRCEVPAQYRRMVGDLRVAAPAWTIAELAEQLSLVDLVIAIDSVLHGGHATMSELAGAVVPRRRGVRRLRQALTLADGRAESPWETVLRLLHRLAGVDVEPQYEVTDEHGRFVARADLWVRGTTRLPECDGAGHRDRGQHQADLAREKALARAGFERFGYVAREILADPGRIIRDADAARGADSNPRRPRAAQTG